MPKVSIAKYNEASTGEYKVRLAGEITRVLSIPGTHPPEQLAQHYLRPCVR
jgi:hypothetical protein